MRHRKALPKLRSLPKLAVSHRGLVFSVAFEEPDTFTTIAEAHRNRALPGAARRSSVSRGMRRSRSDETATRQAIRRSRNPRRPVMASSLATLEHVLGDDRSAAFVRQNSTARLFGLTGAARVQCRRSTVAERAAVRAAEAVDANGPSTNRRAQRHRLLAKASEQLLESDLSDSFQRLAELMVGEITDYVFVHTIEGTTCDGARHIATRDGAGRQLLRGVRTLRPNAERPWSAARTSARSHHGASFERLSSTVWRISPTQSRRCTRIPR